MQIRKITKLDVPKLIPLVRAFHNETLKPFGMGFDPASVESTLLLFAEHHIGLAVLFEDEIVGVIGGVITPSFTDYNQKMFAESMWYVLPEHRGGSGGVKLLKLVEDYCKKIGVNKIIMIGMFDENIEKLGGFYNRMGYNELEIHYQKDLNQ